MKIPFINCQFSYYTDQCLLTNNILDYHNVAQGKTTIPGVDDGEECLATDVRLLNKLKITKYFILKSIVPIYLRFCWPISILVLSIPSFYKASSKPKKFIRKSAPWKSLSRWKGYYYYGYFSLAFISIYYDRNNWRCVNIVLYT